MDQAELDRLTTIVRWVFPEEKVRTPVLPPTMGQPGVQVVWAHVGIYVVHYWTDIRSWYVSTPAFAGDSWTFQVHKSLGEARTAADLAMAKRA